MGWRSGRALNTADQAAGISNRGIEARPGGYLAIGERGVEIIETLPALFMGKKSRLVRVDRMSPMKSWFARWISRERRSTGRQHAPTVVAHYWPGAVSSGEVIRDISPAGFYMQTAHRWYPGTVFKINLQHTYGSRKGDNDSVTVFAMVIRIDRDGAGFMFVSPNSDERGESLSSQSDAEYRESISQFLEKVKRSDTEARFDLERA